MLKDDHDQDMATLARYGQVTRARITQIMNLLLLAPDIQEAILNLPKLTSGHESTTIRNLQSIALESDWTTQRVMWTNLNREISQN